MSDRTKTEILQAFNRLIEKNDIERITVGKLCAEGNIGRTTFYRYFKDKYDVMNYNFQKIIDQYFNTRDVKTAEELFLILFTEGSNNFKMIKRSFGSTGANSLHNFIYECSYNVAEKVAKINNGGKGFTEEEKLQAEVFCHGVSYMYEKWIKGEFNLTPNQAAKALSELLPESFRTFTW